MKQNTHPKYTEVLFVDSATGHKFVCGSTAKSDQRETFQGKEYPVVHLAISSSSHPYFVGGKQYMDTEGRVDRFTNRYKKVAQAKAAPQEVVVEEKKPVKKAAAKKKA